MLNRKTIIKLVVVLAIPVILWNVPAPSGLEADTWHLVAVYLGLLAGLIIKPMSEPVITLIILGFGIMFMEPTTLLSGYGDSMAWFLATVTIVCTAFVKTGLGRRMAYIMLGRSGNSTLGLGYLMMLTDLILSPATGSNSSRTTIIYPIFRNIAESVDSYPDKNPRKLGGYLTTLAYIVSQSTSALFLTGMATNAITASLALEMLDIQLTWGTWFMASVVPAGLVLLAGPFVVYKLYKPELTELTDVKIQAKENLQKMGKVTSAEKKLFVIFILAVLGWMFGPKLTFVALGTQNVGFVFLALVLITGILNWDDVIGAKGAWNIFVWYGAFYGVATGLANAGFYTWLADLLSKILDLSSVNGLVVTYVLLLVSLVVRYFFVSNSAFVASFFPVIFAIAMGTQADLMVLTLLLAFFASYGSWLTHYGNGAGLIAFASNYVSQKEFWKIGTIMVGVALIIFTVIGLPYWKLIGIW